MAKIDENIVRKNKAEILLVSIDKAAEICGVSKRTIFYWIKKGKVDFVEYAGGRKKIFIDSLWKVPNEEQAEARNYRVEK